MLPGDAKTDFEVGATTKIQKVAQAEKAAREADQAEGAASSEIGVPKASDSEE